MGKKQNKKLYVIITAIFCFSLIFYGMYHFHTNNNISNLFDYNSAKNTAKNLMVINKENSEPIEGTRMIDGKNAVVYEIFDTTQYQIRQREQIEVWKNLNDDGLYKIQFKTYSFRSIAEMFDELQIPLTDEMKNYFKNPEETYKIFKNKNTHMIVLIDTMKKEFNSTEGLSEEEQKTHFTSPYIDLIITTDKELIEEQEQAYKNFKENEKVLKEKEEKEKEFDQYE